MLKPVFKRPSFTRTLYTNHIRASRHAIIGSRVYYRFDRFLLSGLGCFIHLEGFKKRAGKVSFRKLYLRFLMRNKKQKAKKIHPLYKLLNDVKHNKVKIRKN